VLLSLDPPGNSSSSGSSSGGPSQTSPAILGALSSPQLPPAEEAEDEEEEEIQWDGRPPLIRTTAPLLHRTDGPASWRGVMDVMMAVLLFLVPLVSLFLLQVDARHLVPLLP